MLQLIPLMPTWRTRVLLSSGIGLFAGFYCWYLMRHTHQGAGDFISAIRAAKDLLANRNPYASPQQLYPLPAALFGLPFVDTAPEIAAGIFYGLSSAMLTFGITRQGYHHLLIFLAYPYWAGMLTVQWIPLIMASAFFPWLMPVVLAKPQIGLPVATTHASLTGAAACLLVLLASFLIMPHWFPLWMGQLSGYSRFIPLFVFPGPLLVIALLRYRDRDAWLLFLAACMPQRWFYDAFFLWLIPKRRRQIVLTAGCSWIPGIWRWYRAPHSFTEVGRWMVLFCYLPILMVVLERARQGTPPSPEVPGRTDSDAHNGGSIPGTAG